MKVNLVRRKVVRDKDLIKDEGFYYEQSSFILYIGECEEYFDNGQLAERMILKDEVTDGVFLFY